MDEEEHVQSPNEKQAPVDEPQTPMDVSQTSVNQPQTSMDESQTPVNQPQTPVDELELHAPVNGLQPPLDGPQTPVHEPRTLENDQQTLVDAVPAPLASEPVAVIDQKFVLPQIVDDELAAELIRRGANERKARGRRLVLYIFIGGIFGYFMTQWQINVGSLVAILVLLSIVVSKLLAMPVERAMKAGRHDVVARLLPNAIYWASQLSPLSWISYIQLLQTQVNLILIEGRYTELEMVSLYTKGFTERTEDVHVTPKNWAIANNLAIAHMQQGRFLEAAEMFSTALKGAQNQRQSLILLSNLSWCQMRLEQIPAAVENNQKALQINGREMKTSLGCKVLAIETFLKSKEGKLDEAEKLIDSLSANMPANVKTPDLMAVLAAAMADVRWKQKRYDEAKLYFHNVQDLLNTADNPNYIVIAQSEKEYAQLLAESGDIVSSEKALRRAEEYFNFYLRRELDTVELVKLHLASGEPIRQAADLLRLAHRVPYVPSIENQRGPELIDD